MYSQNKNHKKTKKNVKKVIIFALIILLAVLSVIYIIGQTNSVSDEENAANQVTNDDLINFEPPTEQEQQSGDNQKEDLVKDNNSSNTENAEVVIVDSSQYQDIVEVRAFVSNIIRDGTCTITFSKNGESFSSETPARADASTTTCITNDVSINDFSESGVWEVEVRYVSGEISGSTKSTVEVSL